MKQGAVDFLRVTMSDVAVASYEVDSSDDGPPLDQVALACGKIETRYTPVDPTGKPQAPVEAGWDIAAGKKWYAQAFGVEPYFDQPFYVGFNVAGYELGLVPGEAPLHEPGNRGAIAYVCTRADQCSIGRNLREMDTWAAV